MSHKQQQSYKKLPTEAMDNPAMSNSSSGSGSHVDVATSDRLPPTNSSQQLVSSSDSDSIEERPLRGAVDGIDTVPATMVRFSNVGRSQWFTVTVLCFVNLINYMDRFTIAGVLSDIQKDFEIADDAAGLLQTAFVIFYMVFAPLFGYLGDRHSRPWIMAVGVALWSTTTLLGSFMPNYGWFITFRALVGIGEASYSTIAPTIISDMFVNDMRSKMLALFYFAIPVGSGFGYIIGSKTATLANNWRWALRVTPILGIAAVLLILLIKDPERGASEGSHNMETTSYKDDLKGLVKNRSFMLSTCGFTCVAFVTGALAWWGPSYIHLGMSMQPGNEDLQVDEVAYIFGLVAMAAGLIGVPMGSYLAQHWRRRFEGCDPYICAIGLLFSAPMVYASLVLPRTNAFLCYLFMFVAQVFLNLCWSIVADILLYVVVPNRRSTAEAFQILISHAFGDAGSPYLVGAISEAIKKQLVGNAREDNRLVSLALTAVNETSQLLSNGTERAIINLRDDTSEYSNKIKFEGLQYALFSTTFVEVLGGIFFLLTACYIIKDKTAAVRAVAAHHLRATSPSHNKNDVESIDSDSLVICTDIALRVRK
ncbi:protein spinster isoform X1 [Scaptodrosophila lebanonensis]|uniref:Protein spinster isoform X1 n=1 Tax=Drosophila lebanonensis TaxID=7225 RepID=A0A6J2TTZ2_DROLE|nr:protein spinster isoform X1 [Scaptodrosophila lebanonensis]